MQFLLDYFSVLAETTTTQKKSQREVEENVTIATDYAKKSIDDELADKVKNYITTTFLTEADLRAITQDQRHFQLYKIDVNNDGNEEVFVNFATSYFCGTGGCTVLLLDSNLKLITRFSPTRTLYDEKKAENEWRILLTQTEGDWRKLVFENGTYPSNPTMVERTNDETEEHAEIMFDADKSKQKTYSF